MSTLAIATLSACGQAAADKPGSTDPGRTQTQQTAPECNGGGYALFDEYVPSAEGAASPEVLAAGYADEAEQIFWLDRTRGMASVIIGTSSEPRIMLTMHRQRNGWLADGVIDC
ncbi:MAG TPA: hypothetical protein VFX15_07570 [Actinomycetes bacterium]|nr:hypothetical protein [Actinomycetes bacterium]